jgi:hypothetical protein
MKTTDSLKVEALTIGKNLKKAEEQEDYELCEMISTRLSEIDKEIISLVEGVPLIRISASSSSSSSFHPTTTSDHHHGTNQTTTTTTTPNVPGGVVRVKHANSTTHVDVDHTPGGLTRESIQAMFDTAKGHREYIKMKILKLMMLQLDEVRVQLGDLKVRLSKAESVEDFEKCEV